MVVVKASALFLGLASLILPVSGQAVNDVADAFDLAQVSLTDSRWMDNQNRTLNYLLSIDPDRLLYVFRKNHGLDTKGAQTNGGWDAPDFPFRSHVQGHFLSAWTQCYASAGVKECGSRATYFVQELAKCQANNEKAGFNKGYLSGFSENDISKVEDRTLSNGNVPYYAIHKTLAGLLDVYRRMGDQTAKDTMLSLASWVDTRTSKLSYNQMQSMLQTEFGGMNEVLADIAFYTKDAKWLKVAQRFDHAVIFDPCNRTSTNSPVFTPTLNFPSRLVLFSSTKHTYAISGNSQAEHFRAPDAIAGFLTDDTCEACNSYNMLKLTRELWALNPTDASYFDFYEKVLLNHLLGQQNPSSDHGHVTYFTPLKADGRRGVGPAWGGGVETNTKLMDSIYFHSSDTLYVNLFTPSKLNWSQKKVSVTQTTDFPESDTSTFKISASIKVNGQAANVAIQSSKYALIKRQWKSGDTVTVQLPMSLHTVAANDGQTLGAIAFGPVILVGNYGESTLNGNSTIYLASIKRKSNTGLTFGATSGGKAIELGPFYDAQGFNYAVYWKLSGKLSG
ncbi:hypothetical protein FAGAP_3373 [Fusarium agapanthi]|uniref:Secreted protein n=1 Tax=Fusarium agapanthi TaxID=1803897 RepID=A0A9P5BFH0_9HYPO|nr:hypothetical protein FAGAP_3373 [Fusarium agapanthi]